MDKSGKSFIAILAAVALTIGMSGCKKEEGPAEKAGHALDNAVNKAGQQMEKAGEAIQDAAKGKK
jgi:predicted small secreted protein